ncbi:hypothetical protein AAHE18_08G217500 [Arachis hypogaea]
MDANISNCCNNYAEKQSKKYLLKKNNQVSAKMVVMVSSIHIGNILLNTIQELSNRIIIPRKVHSAYKESQFSNISSETRIRSGNVTAPTVSSCKTITQSHLLLQSAGSRESCSKMSSPLSITTFPQ